MNENNLSIGRNQNEFNNAVQYLNRLNNIFILINDAKYRKNNNDYLNFLQMLFHEISTEMREEEINKFIIEFKNKKEELKRIKIFSQKTRLQPHNEIDEDLEKIELRLRKIYKDAGLQNKVKEDWSQPDEEW